MKKLSALLVSGLLVMGLTAGCGSQQATPHLVQMDDGKYTMNTGDEYGVVYVKGYSDDNVTNYMMIRVIGEDNNKTVDELIKCYNNNGFKALKNIQYIGEAVEYKGEVYNKVNASTHVYKGQKIIINAKSKDNQKMTIDGTFKEYALGEITDVERDNTGHLIGYAVKVVQDMKLVKGEVVEHLEVNE